MKTNYNFNSEEKKIRRMMMLILLLIFVRLISAQEYLKSDNGKDSFPRLDPPLYILKIAPLGLLGAYEGPSLRVGLEYPIKGDWSGYTELIHYFYNTGDGVKLEFKWWAHSYQFDRHSLDRDYVAVEFFYKHQCYKASDTIIMPYEKYNKEYNVNKSVECLTIRYGTQTAYKCGITVDLFAGLGIRLKQASNTLSYEENENIQHWGDYGTNRIVNMAGNFIYPNFDVGVKIGFKLK
jgi:hypothetical protein